MSESSTGTNPSRIGLAEAILADIPVGVVRKEVRLRKPWASNVYPGFRADSLTREMILRGSSRFAASVPLLSQLCSVYLDNLGVPPNTRLSQRLADAMGDAGGFPEALRDLVLNLNGRTLEEIPVKVAQPPDAAITGENGSIGSPELQSPETLNLPTAPLTGPTDAEIFSSVSPVESGVEASGPEFLRERVFLTWAPPDDDVEEAQKAVTLFGRSLTAFIRRQLEGAFGDRWFESGCPKDVRDALKVAAARAETNGLAVAPASMLGYAELGHLFKILLAGNNWSYFKPYFGSREEVQLREREVLSLRVSAMHPEEREVSFLTNVAKFAAMAAIAEAYDPTTARAISDLCESVAGPPEEPPAVQLLVAERIWTNVDSFRDPQLSGREAELKELERFWNDPFDRVISISGAGGVGKTALIRQFVYTRLQQVCPPGKDPDPHGLVYLTAKNNYLAGFNVQDPVSMRFGGLGEVLDSTIGLGLDGDRVPTGTDAERQLRSLEIAEAFRVLFVLDNLETLSPEAAAEINVFVSKVPRPSKVILTSRVGREEGTKLVLKGLPPDDARTLLERKLSLHGDLLENHDANQIERIIDYAQGFPMTLVHCANLMGKSGYTVEETMEKLRGATMLEFLEFSFASSIESLSESAFRVLAFLSFASAGKSRKELEQVVSSQEALDDIIYSLMSISFVELIPDAKKSKRLRLTSEQLRDYVNSLARTRLSDAVFGQLRGSALPLPETASPSLEVEIDRSLSNAYAAASDGWDRAAAVLQGAIAKWGEDPRMVAELGYYYFRMQQRPRAIGCFERAIQLGSDSPRTYTDLAIVLFHEKDYEGAQRRAETALTLDPASRVAHQVVAQCLVRLAERGRLTVPDERRLSLFERAIRHAQASQFEDERSDSQMRHNALSRQWIGQAEEGISAIQTSIRNATNRWAP